VSEVEIVARVERRRKWTIQEKAARLAKVEAGSGKTGLVARRYRISESLLYNWRSAWKAAAAVGPSGAVEFMPLGVFGEASIDAAPPMLSPPGPPRSQQAGESKAGAIEIALPNGSRVSVDVLINETALSRVKRPRSTVQPFQPRSSTLAPAAVGRFGNDRMLRSRRRRMASGYGGCDFAAAAIRHGINSSIRLMVCPSAILVRISLR
jgi:transposase-like protein